MSIRINVGADFDAKDLRAARRELDNLQRQMDDTATGFRRAGRVMQDVGQTMVGVGSIMTRAITAPLVGAGIAATKTAADFQQSMSRIVGLVGIAADEVRGMERGVLALSKETAKSPQELAEALFVVTSAGLRGADAMEALRLAAQASAAGLGQTNDIARAVAGSMNAYGSEVVDAARATDVIVATARAGNFETSQFAAALGRVLPFAQQAGASINDLGGAVALLTRTNGNAAESITQVQALFRSFVVPTAQARRILDEIGLSAEDLRNTIQRDGLVAALRRLDGALGGNREQLGLLLSSSEAASAAFQILGADSQTIAGTFGAVANAAGLTGEAFNIAADQSAFKFSQALNDLKIIAIELGNQLLPFATQLVEKFRELVDRFNNLTDAQQKTIIKFGVFIGLIGPAIAILGGLITIIGGVVIALGAMSTAMIIATGGLVLVGAAIAGIAWKQATRDANEFAESQRIAARNQREAAIRTSAQAREFYALQDAQSQSAQAARLNGLAAQFAETGFSAYSKEAQAARRATEQSVDPTDGLAAAFDALGEAANGNTETEGGGGASAKVVALSSSMKSLFRELNQTNVATGSAGASIAQFAREVLAMGNITEGTIRGAERLAQVIRQDIDKALAEGNRRLEEATRKFDAFRDTIARGIRQGNTLSDAVASQTSAIEALTRAEEDYEKALASQDEDRIEEAGKALIEAKKQQQTFLDFLRTGVTTAEGFAAQIDALRKAGASMEVVQQIAELGAKTGGRVASELLAGGAAAIEQANRMVEAVEKASIRAGEAAAQQFFGAGIAAARAMIAGIEATIPELQSILDRIADAIERAMGTRPNVSLSGESRFIPAQPPSPPTRPTPQPSDGRLSRSQVQFVPDFGFVPLAAGGLVTSPTFALVGEAGPEMVIPLDRMGDIGGQTIINVTVTSADPVAVVEALRRYTRANGPLGSVVKV